MGNERAVYPYSDPFQAESESVLFVFRSPREFEFVIRHRDARSSGFCRRLHCAAPLRLGLSEGAEGLGVPLRGGQSKTATRGAGRVDSRFTAMLASWAASRGGWSVPSVTRRRS